MRISDWSSDVCSSDLDGGVDRGVTGDVEIADELVEEQPAQALGAAGVPGEQRPLHHLWEVHEREHRAVEVREVAPQDISLVGCEVLGDVDGHQRSWASAGTRIVGPSAPTDRGPHGDRTSVV